MIFSKKINFIHLSLVIILLIIWGVMFHDVNTRIPNAKELRFTADNPAKWKGCEITPISKTIYTVEDFMAAYPNNHQWDYIVENNDKDKDASRVIVFKAKVKNITDTEVKFSLSTALAEAIPSAWHNGVPPLTGKSKLAVGEESIVEVSSLYSPVMVNHLQIGNMDSNEFHLVLSYYPVKIILVFN